jgi:hypothetical protein
MIDFLFELRTSVVWTQDFMVGRRSTTGAMPPTLFALVILKIWSFFLPSGPGWWSSYFMFPTVAGMTSTWHCTQLLIELKSSSFLLRLGLNSDPFNLNLQNRWITGVSHWCPVLVWFLIIKWSSFIYNYSLLSVEHPFQDPQWIPEMADNIEPYIFYYIFYTFPIHTHP